VFIPHASKILLKIIQGSLATYIEREISEQQAGFRKGRGMRDQIENIRWVQKEQWNMAKQYLCP
jgi:hypothetical protein